jgi:hypothetical protein
MVKITLEIDRIAVLLSDGADKVFINTTLPSSMPKVSQQCLSMDFQTEIDTGIEYVRHHFGIEPEVINTRHTKTLFIKKEQK